MTYADVHFVLLVWVHCCGGCGAVLHSNGERGDVMYGVEWPRKGLAEGGASDGVFILCSLFSSLGQKLWFRVVGQQAARKFAVVGSWTPTMGRDKVKGERGFVTGPPQMVSARRLGA